MARVNRGSQLIIGAFGKMFYELGRLVCKFPRLTIAVSCSVPLLCSLGLVNFRIEHRAAELWLPRGSRYKEEAAWKEERFPKEGREALVLVQGENVLTPSVLRLMLEINTRVEEMVTPGGRAFKDLCKTVPTGDGVAKRRKRRGEEEAGDRENLIRHFLFFLKE